MSQPTLENFLNDLSELIEKNKPHHEEKRPDYNVRLLDLLKHTIDNHQWTANTSEIQKQHNQLLSKHQELKDTLEEQIKKINALRENNDKVKQELEISRQERQRLTYLNETERKMFEEQIKNLQHEMESIKIEQSGTTTESNKKQSELVSKIKELEDHQQDLMKQLNYLC